MAPTTLVIVSPVFNEAEHIDRVARAIAAQTRTPDAWIVVDDASTDGTADRLRALSADLPFMRIVSQPPSPALERSRDRLAAAAAPRAFNAGIDAYEGPEFDFVGKLDGDIELPPHYFETLLARFDGDPSLGIACGDLVEDHDGEFKRIPIPSHHVHGALKLYRRSCYEAIGGVRPTLGWDTIDETYARLRGYRTRSFGDLVAHHHRHWGSAQGKLRGRARHGVCAWICGYGPTWIALRAFKIAAERPRGLSGMAFLFGYVRAAVVRTPRVADPEFRGQVRHELRERLVSAFRRREPQVLTSDATPGGA